MTRLRTPSQYGIGALRTALKCNAEHLILTHFSARIRDAEEATSEAKEVLGDSLVLLQPMMVTEFESIMKALSLSSSEPTTVGFNTICRIIERVGKEG